VLACQLHHFHDDSVVSRLALACLLLAKQMQLIWMCTGVAIIA